MDADVLPTVVLDENMLDNEEHVYKIGSGFFVTRAHVVGAELASPEEYIAFLRDKNKTRDAIIEAAQKRRAEAAIQKQNEEKAAVEEILDVRRLHAELQDALKEMKELAAQMKKTPKTVAKS